MTPFSHRTLSMGTGIQLLIQHNQLVFLQYLLTLLMMSGLWVRHYLEILVQLRFIGLAVRHGLLYQVLILEIIAIAYKELLPLLLTTCGLWDRRKGTMVYNKPLLSRVQV